MQTTQTFAPTVRKGVMMLAMPTLLWLNGCDYWPPALQSQIETLRADLDDAMDERQRMTLELAELQSVNQSLVQETKTKTDNNSELERRLSVLAHRNTQRSSAKAETAQRARPAAIHTVSGKTESSHASISKGSFTTLRLEHPALRGPKVVQLQKLLRRHELPIRVDGIFGRNMEAAIRSFQRVHGLQSDGTVGPATYMALRRAAPTARLARHLSLQRPPLMGQDVSTVQRALRRAGYRIPLDGQYGPATDIAVTRFQQKHGIEPDGMVGPQTWTALSSVLR